MDVLIYVDVAAAMAAGIRFYRSANNVICSPGPIPPAYFAHVCRRSDESTLMLPRFQRTRSQTARDSHDTGNTRLYDTQ